MKINNIKMYSKVVLTALLLCIPFSFLQSCSDDDEKQNEFEKIITWGAWAQDGDNDIIIFNSDGTWYAYDSPEEFGDKEAGGFAGTWSYSNNTLTFKQLYRWDDDVKEPVEDYQRWTEVYTVTNFSNDFFSCTQIYPKEEKDRVMNYTRFK